MKSESTKSTILVICTVLLMLHVLFSWQWTVYASLGIGIIGVSSSYLSEKIHRFWINLSEILGLIVPRIILSLLFFIVLLPISILFRIFNKDPLMLSTKYDSYFINVNKNYDKKSFENTW
mgnify:CR=1 FL=1